MNRVAQASVAKWLDHQPMHQSIEGWIPSQGHVPRLQIGSLALVGAYAGSNQWMYFSH